MSKPDPNSLRQQVIQLIAADTTLSNEALFIALIHRFPNDSPTWLRAKIIAYKNAYLRHLKHLSNNSK